jgi:alpha-D-xyloside xylohydrolase
MLGSELLIAPVFDKDGEVTFYVPFSESGETRSTDAHAKRSKWRSFLDHTKTYEEGRWYTETHGFDTMPILLRPGAIVPFNPSLKIPEGDIMKGLQVLVNGPLKGERSIELVEASDVAKVAKTFTLDESLTVKGIEGVKVVDVSKG